MKMFSAVCVIAVLAASSSSSNGFAADSFDQSIRPLLRDYCVTCHSTEKQEGELDLERFISLEQVKRHAEVWERVQEQMAMGEMPPKDAKQLSAEQRRLLAGWVRSTLNEIALANSGDPGPVVLRRLSNYEYTYSLRDLTGVPSLDPAREFPVDGAAGEGFTNVGSALVMSPALLSKYLEAAKDVASHMVLTPTGIRFSAGTSSRDATNETLARIRDFYARSSDTGEQSVEVGGTGKVSSKGGMLPLNKYLAAATQERVALANGSKKIADVARERGLSAKYLGLLWTMLQEQKQEQKPSLVLDSLRVKWREGNLAAADIEPWQKALWRFSNVGHLGKVGGPKSWLEPVTPLATQHELRMKLQPPPDGSDLTLYFSTSDAGDGDVTDVALWDNARLITPGRGELLLRDVRSVLLQMERHRAAVGESAVRCLAAAHEAESAEGKPDLAALAQKHNVDAKVLAGWLTHLGIGGAGGLKLEPLLVKKTQSVANYDFIKGWAGDNALSVMANSSDATARIPGEMKPHSIATHPSPKLASVIAWRSPVGGTLRISGSVQDGDTACGNGILYSLELRRGQTREVLATGESKGSSVISLGPLQGVSVMQGDVVALVIDPRNGEHACDHTPVNLTLSDGKLEWDLVKDVSPDILASNPHADRHGNSAVWHFLSQPASGAASPTAAVDSASLLLKWRKVKDTAERAQVAAQVQQLLQQDDAAAKASPADRALRQQLLSLDGPLLADAWRSVKAQAGDASASPYGLDPAVFGKHPRGGEVAATSLCVQAPSIIEVRLPASLLTGVELVATGRLHPASGSEASVQMQIHTTKLAAASGLRATSATLTKEAGAWNSSKPPMMFDAPILVAEGSDARRRFETAFDDFRALFPAALCYTKIVPVDEVVTLTLFHREDEPLRRLMLNDDQIAELDRLWDELHFVSEDALTLVDAYEQIWQFSTQDGPNAPNGDKRLEPLREPIMAAAAKFKEQKKAAIEPQKAAVLALAEKAWRRPLTESETTGLRKFEPRLMLVRILTSPAYLYRSETPATQTGPVNDWELATRLSYFLWSSVPDDELRGVAAAGRLRDPDVLAAQARRMLKDDRIRRLATEFGCQHLHVRDVATLDEKSERHFPAFKPLREAMQEEVTRFYIDLFQNDRSSLLLLDADYTFLNKPLADHYGIPFEGSDWQRVEGIKKYGRGGALGFSATLAKHSGASRTSAILRGMWVSEVLLGDKIPNPPKGVPTLPEEAPEGLSERQLIERHSSDVRCAGCHKRIDPFGFALEGFDAIGRTRAADTKSVTFDGTAVEGLAGLRDYLANQRRADFLRQFSRKLLGYSLGRSAQLSDQPLIDNLSKTEGGHVGKMIEQIVRSPQFREIRGRDSISSNPPSFSGKP
ncbi:hypothetical protein ETAA8_00450 [Anatilimnocola aggregata]|uniref:DUF1592 domain-containing protein n=1 Tax=Anatilimnocola aggregata TaxID=2528021 RepID=A0A517Y426_9BACT|nr:DUF1592 domain-containing protein [Anatilimnocola aggregata]QDU24984.1 hypothetical protein ETAA8_00450 [Anatilimnocola aggregata]